MNSMVIVSYGLFLVLLYALLIYPKNKQAKKIQTMRNALKVGDEVVTIGGMAGRITWIDDEEITLETGPERAHVQFKKWAVGSLDVKKIDKGFNLE